MAAALLALLLAFVSLGTGLVIRPIGGDQGCENGWTPFDSRCYKFFNRKSSWMDAETSCLRVGANLVSVHSLEENTFIGDLIFKATGSNTGTWLGGTDAVVNNRWMWSDGTRWDFEQWFTDEPNNRDGREEGLMINFHDETIFGPVFMNLDDTTYHCTPDM
uniref:C-type lectin domain-containing protein n=1 Tax=Knipowitschia caucasica TaxID=637954 RepID=A0AAV2L344_KNICA